MSEWAGTSLGMFHSSCGHTNIYVLKNEEWEIFANQGNRTRVGRKTRMVYIHPWRYTICAECMMEEQGLL